MEFVKYLCNHWENNLLKMLLISYFQGNSPPGLIPAKSLYMKNDLQRLGNYYNVGPFHLPSVSGCLFLHSRSLF